MEMLTNIKAENVYLNYRVKGTKTRIYFKAFEESDPNYDFPSMTFKLGKETSILITS